MRIAFVRRAGVRQPPDSVEDAIETYPGANAPRFVEIEIRLADIEIELEIRTL